MSEKQGIKALRFFRNNTLSNPLNLLKTLLRAIDSKYNNTEAIWRALPDKESRNDYGKDKVIKATWLRYPDRLKDIPILIIDGSMAIDAIRKLFPEVEHKQVRVRRHNQGPTIQVYSTPVSNRKLVPYYKDSKKRKNEARSLIVGIEHAIQRITDEHGPGLIVAKKIYIENHLTLPENCAKASFGGLLGLNEWEQQNWVAIIGRNQPPAEDMVDLARAFYGNDSIPLDTSDSLELFPRGYQIRTGEKVGTWVQCHSDYRVQQFIHLVRENESEQAIDRIRLVHHQKGQSLKPIFIISNVPLDIEVDELVSLPQFLSGPSKLKTVWDRNGGRVLPLITQWILKKNRDLFKNSRQVRTVIDKEMEYVSIPYIYTIWNHDILHFKILGKTGSHNSCITSLSIKETKKELENKLQLRIKKIWRTKR